MKKTTEEIRERTNYMQRTRLQKKREIVLFYYGGNPPHCACCGEKEIKFLSIDHINGDGNKHRLEIFGTKKGGSISIWLIRNGFPEGYQVLCHNCNMAKAFYGGCPHKS